jgi:hypothetical protein
MTLVNETRERERERGFDGWRRKDGIDYECI